MPIQPEPTLVQAVVCVPAHNEAERIGGLLASLAAQSVATPATPLKVVVVSNNSTDATDVVARDHASDPRLDVRLLSVTLPPATAHVGTARGLAMDAGADWLETNAIPDGVLISTDADAVAPPGWVRANLVALRHADLVGGRLVIEPSDTISGDMSAFHARIERYWAAVRALEDRLDPPAHDPSPRHGDHTGASLALRASLYRAVGGVPPLATGEDNALVAAVVRAGGRVRHCPDVFVEVSPREAGRATGGMAQEMVRRRRALTESAPYLLPSASHWRAHFLRRAGWRALTKRALGEPASAIAYVARREADASALPADDVPVDIAIAELEAMAARAVRAVA